MNSTIIEIITDNCIAAIIYVNIKNTDTLNKITRSLP